ncbi:hypothetical protein [Crocosphaera sp. XPORK-15E]|uniref:hypothetical protein n=1 Tax=Crocosphaera sp. XPORK-15E TaxID=3110247 RepID=UPI002B1FECE2|nr:hypothetical protein [Crocosphaera sp. XPORK-15E]MEA5532579.1 hypothetical protein [Crocosphaera sp. XPORK-15E]
MKCNAPYAPLCIVDNPLKCYAMADQDYLSFKSGELKNDHDKTQHCSNLGR